MAFDKSWKMKNTKNPYEDHMISIWYEITLKASDNFTIVEDLHRSFAKECVVAAASALIFGRVFLFNCDVTLPEDLGAFHNCPAGVKRMNSLHLVTSCHTSCFWTSWQILQMSCLNDGPKMTVLLIATYHKVQSFIKSTANNLQPWIEPNNNHKWIKTIDSYFSD